MRLVDLEGNTLTGNDDAKEILWLQIIPSKLAQTGTSLTDIRHVPDSHFGRHTECADWVVLVAAFTPYRKIPVDRSEGEILSILPPEATATRS